MQVLTLSGRVGNVKEARDAGNDRVMSFGLAVDNGRDKDPTWYDCELWGKRADSLGTHISKGQSITVMGRPKVRVHDGKAYLGVSIDQLTFGGGPRNADTGSSYSDTSGGYGQSGAYGGGAGASVPGRPYFDDEEIPF